MQREAHVQALLCTGNCTAEIKQYCDGIEPGEARLADCLQEQVEAEETDSTTAEKGEFAAAACRMSGAFLTCLFVRHNHQELQGRAVGLQGAA
jgi:hypothetical protein